MTQELREMFCFLPTARRLFVFTGLGVFSAASALATPLTDFNLIAFGDLTGESEVEGRTAVFGDLAGGSKTFVTRAGGLGGQVSTPGLDPTNGLVVGGSITTGSPINVNNAASTRVGGDASGAVISNNGGGSVVYNDAGVSGVLEAISNDVAAAESFFDSLTVNSTIDLSDGNRANFNAAAGSVAVFEARSTDLFNRNGQFDLLGNLDADLYLIRVTGADDISTSGLNPNSFEFDDDSFQSRIVFYFQDADSDTDLRFDGGLGGSLFARNANLLVTNPLQGTVVANDVEINGEIHLPVTVVPEPATFALLAAGGLMLSSRRRAGC